MTTPKQMIAQMREARLNGVEYGPILILKPEYAKRMYIDLPAVLDLLEKALEMAEEHKWHEDHCTYRIKFHLNNEKLCDCGAFKAKAFLESAQDWAGGK